ncbi:Gfo/Idh/MocA family oxidoreductase [Streptosporangium sp. NBC_01639]|uniref:Gfo/Idh/MocA family protein n=1 Tax=Streptosporangium sp. NBC_01639 TaxID=2975948 RepID=UPI00386F82D7|nr:Gfo/Idh/MocA family oxidoreductase [Streptosporangium sp. NBC_01639]
MEEIGRNPTDVSQLRVGIVGTGFIGGVHARAARLAGARIVGVAGSTPERAARAYAARLAERVFRSAEDLIESGELDVLHVCTPNHLHASITIKALEAGLHVICEKPLATDFDTAALMAARAAQSARTATVPFVYRFHPMAREARQRVAEGHIGRVNLIHGSYLQDWLLSPDDDNWRVDPALGGPSRAFADIGSHWCDLAEFVTGDRIAAVSAQTAVAVPDRTKRPDVPTEDVATVQFRTVGGAVGTMAVSQVSPGRKNRLFLEISGSEASIAFDQEQPETLWLGHRQGSELLVRDPQTLSVPALRYSPLPAGHAQGYHDCFDAFTTDSYAAVRGERPEGLPTFDDGARAARICDSVLASARTRSWVEVHPA